MSLLTEDVVIWTDGGGKAKAAPRPVVGPWRSARFLIHVAKSFPATTQVREATLNGQPGLVFEDQGEITARSSSTCSGAGSPASTSWPTPRSSLQSVQPPIRLRATRRSRARSRRAGDGRRPGGRRAGVGEPQRGVEPGLLAKNIIVM